MFLNLHTSCLDGTYYHSQVYKPNLLSRYWCVVNLVAYFAYHPHILISATSFYNHNGSEVYFKCCLFTIRLPCGYVLGILHLPSVPCSGPLCPTFSVSYSHWATEPGSQRFSISLLNMAVTISSDISPKEKSCLIWQPPQNLFHD